MCNFRNIICLTAYRSPRLVAVVLGRGKMTALLVSLAHSTHWHITSLEVTKRFIFSISCTYFRHIIPFIFLPLFKCCWVSPVWVLCILWNEDDFYFEAFDQRRRASEERPTTRPAKPVAEDQFLATVSLFIHHFSSSKHTGEYLLLQILNKPRCLDTELRWCGDGLRDLEVKIWANAHLYSLLCEIWFLIRSDPFQTTRTPQRREI